MKKPLTLFLITACFISNLYAQVENTNPPIEDDNIYLARNSAYVEALGNGVIYSLNFDRILKKKKSNYYSLRLGFNYLPQINNFTDFNIRSVIIEPCILHDGIGQFLITAGLGFSFFKFSNEYDKGKLILLAPGIGIRFQDYASNVDKLYYHIKWTPLIPLVTNSKLDGFQHSDSRQISLALGFSF
jgi:hypothetical protein